MNTTAEIHIDYNPLGGPKALGREIQYRALNQPCNAVLLYMNLFYVVLFVALDHR